MQISMRSANSFIQVKNMYNDVLTHLVYVSLFEMQY